MIKNPLNWFLSLLSIDIGILSVKTKGHLTMRLPHYGV
uniref:Uncharacterized protein n=1 Tax=Rhizophora mucronata TaxID=61149 RepID=A0A2P2NQU2_RHIMU